MKRTTLTTLAATAALAGGLLTTAEPATPWDNECGPDEAHARPCQPGETSHGGTVPVPAPTPAPTPSPPEVTPPPPQAPPQPPPTTPVPTGSAAISVSKTADHVHYRAGQLVRFTIRLANPGTADLVGVTLRDLISPDLPLAYVPRHASQVGRVVTWTFAHLRAGRAVTVHLYGRAVNSSSTYRCNRARAAGSSAGTILRDRSAACVHVALVQVGPPPILA